jgi:hypothetical protein
MDRCRSPVYGPKNVFLGNAFIAKTPKPASGIFDIAIFSPIGTVYLA